MRNEHAIRVITKAAESTKLTRKEFVDKRYSACPRWDVSKDQIAEIYDRAKANRQATS